MAIGALAPRTGAQLIPRGGSSPRGRGRRGRGGCAPRGRAGCTQHPGRAPAAAGRRPAPRPATHRDERGRRGGRPAGRSGTYPKEFSRAAQPQVLLGDAEAVVGFGAGRSAGRVPLRRSAARTEGCRWRRRRPGRCGRAADAVAARQKRSACSIICIGLDLIGQVSDLGVGLRASDRFDQQATATGWLC